MPAQLNRLGSLNNMKNILLTGPDGCIRKVVRQGLGGAGEKLRVSDARPLGTANPGKGMRYADLAESQERWGESLVSAYTSR
jgi:hypothetical protein